MLTGHSDVDILSPLTSQVGCMAGVDTSIALSSTGKHQLMALLVDSAIGRQPDSCMLPPHTGLRQTLRGRAGHTLLAASCEYPWLKWQHVFNLCREVSRWETARLLWVSGYLMFTHSKLWPFPAQTLPYKSQHVLFPPQHPYPHSALQAVLSTNRSLDFYMPAMLKAASTSAPQTQGPTCQVKCGLQDDGRAPHPLAYAAVHPSIARPDLGQQQGPIGKHGGSAEVWGSAEGRECYLEEVVHRPLSGAAPKSHKGGRCRKVSVCARVYSNLKRLGFWSGKASNSV